MISKAFIEHAWAQFSGTELHARQKSIKRQKKIDLSGRFLNSLKLVKAVPKSPSV